ncbi:MAG: NADH-quinone oxidoreductase subunit J [Anaerolineae bacterium]|nr:NADH-quinone oxidoreductase subunit J [Anaerolineae bacterium]
MTAEVILFFIVGALALASAGLMISSKNAVHSALFLIVNFICVAMMYLLLEAPFLALVQIAVYAGAIMVLFLFVIMLLGAERTGAGAHLRRFPWLPPLGLGLAFAFVLIGALALGQGRIDTAIPSPEDATLRFVHAAPGGQAAVAEPATEEAAADEASAADTTDTTTTEETPSEEPATRPAVPVLPDNRIFSIYVDGELVDDSIEFGEATEFAAVEPGAHVVTLHAAGSDEVLRTTELNLEPSTSVTMVLAGEVDLDFIQVLESETPGLSIVNAYGLVPAVSIADLQNEMFDPKVNDLTSVKTGRMLLPVVNELAYGDYVNETVSGQQDSAPARLQYPAGFINWVVYQPLEGLADEENFVDDGDRLSRALVIRLTETLGLRTGDNALIVIAPERRPDGSLRAIASELPAVEKVAFGSPASLGERLFTDYLLPFQLVAMLLLAAMVGVIVITYRGEHVPKPSRTTRRKVSRPLTSVIASQTGADLTSGAPQLPERTENPAGD